VKKPTPKLDKQGFEIIPDTYVHGYHRSASVLYKQPSETTGRSTTVKYATLAPLSEYYAQERVDYKVTQGSFTIKPGGTKEILIPLLPTADFSRSSEKPLRIRFDTPLTANIVKRINLVNYLQTPISNSLPASVTGLVLTGTGDISGIGNQRNNDISGNDGSNFLDGREGDDILSGFAGNDTLLGGDGFDYLIGGDGNDLLIGTRGLDVSTPEIDILTGGWGNDTFVLGLPSSPFYLSIRGNDSNLYSPISFDELKAIMGTTGTNPKMTPASDSLVQMYLGPLNRAMQEFGINTPRRQRAFLANVAVESGNLSDIDENWGPTAAQKLYEPGSRKATELGNTQKGDGFLYRGRGLIQVTGRANYKAIGKLLNLDLVKNPELATSSPELAARVSGGWWVQRAGINQAADNENFELVMKKVGGAHPANRRLVYEVAKQQIPDATYPGGGSSEYAIIKDFSVDGFGYDNDKIQLSGKPEDYVAYIPPSAGFALFGNQYLAYSEDLLLYNRNSMDLIAIFEKPNLGGLVVDDALFGDYQSGFAVSTSHHMFSYV
jgi:predicted chitinase